MPKLLYAASNPVHLRNFHRPYLAAACKEGWETQVFCPGGYEQEGIRDCIDLPLRKSLFAPVNFQTALQLAQYLRRERFDLICVHTSLAAFFLRLAVMLAGKGNTRVVTMVHGYLFDRDTPFPKRQLLLAAELLCRPVTDRVIVMNSRDLEIAKRYRLGREILSVPGIGVDYHRLDGGDRDLLRKRLGLSEQALLLLYPAEFSRRKNQAFLIRSMAKLPAETVLALPGAGTELEACRKLAGKLGLAQRILFPGQAEEMKDWYAAADLCVSASRSEGLPFHILEGMYAGKPVIGTRVKGIEDLVQNGVGGFLYRTGDEEAFADCVRTLASDPELRRIMGEKNREHSAKYALNAVFPLAIQAMELNPDRKNKSENA